MERSEQAGGCCEGQFNKDVAIDWLERGLGTGPGEEGVCQPWGPDVDEQPLF